MSPKLIIAEDNAEFAQLLALKARRLGWMVTLCGDGGELLDTLPRIDGAALVLLDMDMPKVDGIDAIRTLNQNPDARRFRFCMMTGGNEINTVAARMIAEAGDLPVCKSLYKPFSMDAFATFLAQQATFLETR